MDGRRLSVPKAYFPSLENASESDLSNYELGVNGIGIHWDSLDEDLYVPNLLMQESSVPSEKRLAQFFYSGRLLLVLPAADFFRKISGSTTNAFNEIKKPWQLRFYVCKRKNCR